MKVIISKLDVMKIKNVQGCLGGSVGQVSDFVSGDDFMVPEFETHIRLSASDPLSPSLLPLPPHMCLRARTCSLSLSLPLSKMNKH